MTTQNSLHITTRVSKGSLRVLSVSNTLFLNLLVSRRIMLMLVAMKSSLKRCEENNHEIYPVTWIGKDLLLNELAVLFFHRPKVIPSRYGKAGTKTAKEIVFTTLNASSVRLPLYANAVLFTLRTTMTDRWPSNVRIMASSLEWKAPTVSDIKIAGKTLNLMKPLGWLCSLNRIFGSIIIVLNNPDWCQGLEHTNQAYMPDL